MIHLNESWKDTNLEKFIKKLNINYEFRKEPKKRSYYALCEYEPRKVSSFHNVIDIRNAICDEYSYKICVKMDPTNDINLNLVDDFNSLLLSCNLIEICDYDSKSDYDSKIKITKYIKPDQNNVYYKDIDDCYTVFIFFNKHFCDELFCIYVNKNTGTYYKDEPQIVSNNKVKIITTEIHDEYLMFDKNTKQFKITPKQTCIRDCIIEEFKNTKCETRHSLFSYYDKWCHVIGNGLWVKNNNDNINVTTENDVYVFLNFDYDKSHYCGAENQTLVNVDNSHFFENIGKFLKLYNIKNLKDIDEKLFWRICSGLYIDGYISERSGIARCLKYKTIVINKLLGFDNINNKQFKLNSLHYNAVKKDYYFTRDLSLGQVLQFKFITQDERNYIDRYLLDKQTAQKAKKEDKEYKQYVEDVLKNKDNKYNYSSLKELLRILPNETEKNIRKKFFEVNSNIRISYRRNAWDKLNRTQRKVICVENNNVYDDCYIAEKQLKIKNIGNCCDGYQQTAGGYHWKYVEE